MERDVRKAGREVETETKKAARSIDGTQPSDHLKNTRDEMKKDLGNLGDDVKDAGDRTYPDPQVSDKDY